MNSICPVLMLVFLSAGMASQGYSQTAGIMTGRTGAVNPWSHLQVDNDSGRFRFAVVADHTGGHRPGVFRDAVKKLNLLQPEFVMSIGDFIEGYTADREQVNTEWKEFNRMIDSLQMPFFYIPGNHDFMDKMTAEIWEGLYGTGYYHFVYKDVLFLCLNTEEAVLYGSQTGGIGKAQFEYIDSVLAENAGVRWTMVFMHRPLWLEGDTSWWKEAELLLAERPHTVFAGHRHGYIRYERNGGRYYVLATTGGISKLQGPGYGEFDQVAWVTMTDEGPVIANLMLQGILEENVVTEEMQKLLTYQPLLIEPVFTTDGVVRADSIRLRINNENKFPVWAALKFDVHAVIVPEIIELQKLIPPDSFAVIGIPYIITRSVYAGNAGPIRLYGKFLFNTGAGRDVEISSEYRFLPVKPEFCSYLGRPVLVDGDLSEYNGFPFRGNSQSVITDGQEGYAGDFDGSYEFAVTCDDKYLYIALSVWDDELITADQRSASKSDAIRLVIDARPVIESANNRGQDNYNNCLLLNFSIPGSGKGLPVADQRDGLPEKTLVSCRKTVQGADVEIAVPVDYLNKMNGSLWKNFRLNLAYFDSDKDSPPTEIWWRPDWGSSENYVGSGTFFRIENNNDE